MEDNLHTALNNKELTSYVGVGLRRPNNETLTLNTSRRKEEVVDSIIRSVNNDEQEVKVMVVYQNEDVLNKTK